MKLHQQTIDMNEKMSKWSIAKTEIMDFESSWNYDADVYRFFPQEKNSISVRDSEELKSDSHSESDTNRMISQDSSGVLYDIFSFPGHQFVGFHFYGAKKNAKSLFHSFYDMGQSYQIG